VNQQANSSRAAALEDIKNWESAGDEDAVSIAKDEIRKRWPGNGGDGSPTIRRSGSQR
jgi:hypothetical protein